VVRQDLQPRGAGRQDAPFLTLAALTVLGAQAEPQIKATVRHALEAGATKREIAEVIWQMSMFGGLPAMQKALEIAQAVFAEKKDGTP
jgi:4-carboxymuconolactone decarboxylase